jgi:hypothetical protein
VVNGALRRSARINLQLPQQAAKTDSGALVANPDSDRSIFVVRAHSDHGPLEARIGHSGHCEKELARQISRFLGHVSTMVCRSRSGKRLWLQLAAPICRPVQS